MNRPLSLPAPPAISGVFETVLYASDVMGTAVFYSLLLGIKPLRQSGQAAVFRLAPDSMLLLMDPSYSEQKGRGAPHHGARGQGHVALRIADADYTDWRARLLAMTGVMGVKIEMEVTWPPGGRSIYFRDPAGNSVELAAGDVWGA